VLKGGEKILQLIKRSVVDTAPGAVLILYGSYARGDENVDSDIDLIILVDAEKERISHSEKIRVTYPLYEIEFQTGKVISPIVYSKKAWANHLVTPFYENILNEGVVL
jgi:uncharacterized protein